MTVSSPRPVLSVVIVRRRRRSRDVRSCVPSMVMLSSAVAGPHRDAVGEVAGSPCRRQVVDRGGSQAADLDLGAVDPRRGRRVIRDDDVRVADGRGLVADEEQVPACAGVDVEVAADEVEVALEEVRLRHADAERRGDRLVRELGHVEAVVAAVGVDVGDRRRAAGVEDVARRAEVDVQPLVVREAVVVDALAAVPDVERVVEVAIVDRAASPAGR